MSDISLPPDAPKTGPKKTSNSGTRSLLLFVALIAPMPVMIAVTEFWLTYTAAGQARKEIPFEVIRHIISDSSDPPTWLAFIALLPSLALLMVVTKTTPHRVMAFTALIVFALLEVMAFSELPRF
ncbi:MAG: hypothetical protein PSY14_05950 [bacterium]|nr:hypothetical protein [bacterium]